MQAFTSKQSGFTFYVLSKHCLSCLSELKECSRAGGIKEPRKHCEYSNFIQPQQSVLAKTAVIVISYSKLIAGGGRNSHSNPETQLV